MYIIHAVLFFFMAVTSVQASDHQERILNDDVYAESVQGYPSRQELVGMLEARGDELFELINNNQKRYFQGPLEVLIAEKPYTLYNVHSRNSEINTVQQVSALNLTYDTHGGSNVFSVFFTNAGDDVCFSFKVKEGFSGEDIKGGDND